MSRKSKVRSNIKTKYGAIIVLLAALLSVLGAYLNGGREKISPDADAEFHFIDVGQGDASMIITDESVIVIDCGPTSSADILSEYIGKYTDKIDCLIFSHAHEDHMGGASRIIDDFIVDEIIMTGYASDSAFFSRALDSMVKKDVKVTEAEAGAEYTVGNVKLEIFSPVQDYGDMNNNSIVMRASVDSVSALFTGDAEDKAESDILESFGHKISSNILKTGHHGSSTSTSEKFLLDVLPDIAVISCGEGNSYGHPHKETTKKFDKYGITYYRTDIDGSIVISCENGELKYKPAA